MLRQRVYVYVKPEKPLNWRRGLNYTFPAASSAVLHVSAFQLGHQTWK